jgi:hypothetical protein
MLPPLRDGDDPAVPEVEPAAEPAAPPGAADEAGPMLAFVRMNDAPAPDPDPVRDAGDPGVVEPVVPVAPPVSPRCRQPVTVMVSAEPVLLGGCCELPVCGLLVCAATIAAHPKPMANATPALFIDASIPAK